MTGTGSDTVGVVVVDDHPDVRAVVGRLVASTGEWSLVGAVASVDAALELVAGGGVDLVLADVVMPGGGGVVLARRLDGLDGAPAVVLMSSYHLDDLGPGATDGPGVAGFVAKSELSPDRLRLLWRRATGVTSGDGDAEHAE